jgi:hypothetical protein
MMTPFALFFVFSFVGFFFTFSSAPFPSETVFPSTVVMFVFVNGVKEIEGAEDIKETELQQLVGSLWVGPWFSFLRMNTCPCSCSYLILLLLLLSSSARSTTEHFFPFAFLK